MRPHDVCLQALMWLCSVTAVFAQPPLEYALQQNYPNPFCGQTQISFALPIRADLTLEVWDPDSTRVVRTLVRGNLAAGYHMILWDGLDDQGAELADGSYPYVLQAVEVPGVPPAYTASLRATIACPTPSQTRSWGFVRWLYRRL